MSMVTPRYGALRVAWRSSDFRTLWLATMVSQGGVGMQQVVLGWLILAMTDSSAMVGVVFALRAAPNLLVGFAAGAMTDRFDRRTLMRTAAFGMALVSWTVSGLLLQDRLVVGHVLAYASVVGVLFAFDMTARQAYVYDMVGANGAIQGIALQALAQRLGGALGALLAGVTLQWWGASAAFLVMGCCYGISGCTLYALRYHGDAAPKWREPLRQNLRNYVQALRSNGVMRSLMLSTAAAEVLGFSHQVMLPVLARGVLHVGAAGLGVLTAFRFVGGVLGVGMLTIYGHICPQGKMLLCVLGFFGAGLVALAYAPDFWLAVVCVIGINVMASATDILHHTLLQVSVANEQRGRAMGSWIVGTGAAPLGHLEIGTLAGMTSAHVALLTNGLALMALPLLLALCLPRLRRL
jgi:MFS family permease